MAIVVAVAARSGIAGVRLKEPIEGEKPFETVSITYPSRTPGWKPGDNEIWSLHDCKGNQLMDCAGLFQRDHDFRIFGNFLKGWKHQGGDGS
jgi:hypothetical protein